jgi:hypothetical protein
MCNQIIYLCVLRKITSHLESEQVNDELKFLGKMNIENDEEQNGMEQKAIQNGDLQAKIYWRNT